MKTSELKGAALDWAVSEIENPEPTYYIDDQGLEWEKEYSPSTNWAQGGPIIERERIDIWAWEKNWSAGDNKALNTRTRGPTPLIAAMRCYVASKLGDLVEIPSDLIK